ncbi:DPB4 [Candida pseudojiufengensis]|uniref:DPB4 n=1 Tax=Candida pseudojiufengensis TaxID=497109 RepID=UPI002224306B|nr:DPB4 [Candida pseudojiufengensis]KAI5964723.1 DPB4 [Candida pseudojiufengensis]
MPPKGWKKNADPSQQPSRDLDPVSIDDILFPRSTIQKLAKSIISDEENSYNMTIAKDSLLALQRSATVFASYMLYHAKQISKASGRKTINAQDMLLALERAEFGGFVPEIKDKLASYEVLMSAKKQKKLEEKSENIGNIPKKSKTIDGTAVSKLDDETDEEEIGDGDDDSVEDVNEDNDDKADEEIDEYEEEEDDDEETVSANPISELSKDEEELEGRQMEEDTENLDEEEEEEDEE